MDATSLELLIERKVAEAVAKAVAKANAERDKEFAKLRDEFEAKANALIAERGEFEAKANALIAEKTMASAREKLHRMLCSPSSGTLSELLEGIDESKLPEVPASYYSEYLDVSGDQNTSRAYLAQSASSVTNSSMAADTLAISKLRLKMTQDTSSKINLFELDVSNNTVLETTLCKELFGENRELFESFISEKMLILGKLQQALYHHGKRFEGARVDELTELQPIAAMFLEDVAKCRYPNVEGHPAQRELLEGRLFIGNNTESSDKRVSGYTDLVFTAESGFSGLEDIIFLVELKAPNSALYQSGAFASKDQIIFEAEILGQMTTNGQLVLGGLLDMFTIAVVLRTPAADSNATFYISPRVVDARAFIVHVLLLLCKDMKAVWDVILPSSTKEIDQIDDTEDTEENAEETGHGEGECNRDENEGIADQGGSGGDENSFQPGSRDSTSRSLFMKEAAAQLKIWRDLDRKEAYEHSVRRHFAWDNKRKNLKNLTESELNTINQCKG